MTQDFKIWTAWVLFYLGHFSSKVVGIFPYAYPVYNYLMCKSSDLQGKDPRGPWVQEDSK